MKLNSTESGFEARVDVIMHRLATTPITLESFEMDDYQELEWDDPEGFMENYNSSFVWDTLIDALETLRKKFNETKNEEYCRELVRLMPQSYKWAESLRYMEDYFDGSWYE